MEIETSKEGIKQKGLKSSVWNFLSLVCIQLRNFIVSLILSRLLSPEDFGIIGMAMSFAGFVEAFVDFGFGNAIIQKDDASQIQLSTIFIINMLLGVVLSLIMFLSSSLVASYYRTPELSLIVKVLSGTFIIKALEGVQTALMKKKLDFKTPFLIDVSSGIVSGILGVVLAFSGFGVWSLVVMQITGWIIRLTLIWARSSWRPSLEFDLHSISELWQFGYKFSLSTAIGTAFIQIDSLVIGRLFSAAKLGLFHRAKSLSRMVVQFSFSPISTVIFPAISRIKNNKNDAAEIIKKLLHAISFMAFLVSGLMYVCSREVIVILYTEKWINALPFYKILGLFTFCSIISDTLVLIINGLGFSGRNLKFEMLRKLIWLCAIPMGIYFGLYEYVLSTNIAIFIGMLLSMYALKCINLSMKTQLGILITYCIPFFMTIVVAHYINFDFIGNDYILLFIKGILYLTFYLLYNFIFRTKGIGIITNNLILPLVNKYRTNHFAKSN